MKNYIKAASNGAAVLQVLAVVLVSTQRLKAQDQPLGYVSRVTLDSIAVDTALHVMTGRLFGLENGAAVTIRITGAFIPNTYGKAAVLLLGTRTCRIAIAEVKSFECNLQRRPFSNATSHSAELSSLHEVRVDGAVLVLENGSVFEVTRGGQSHALEWPQDAQIVILDDTQAINIDALGWGDRVSVLRIR